MENVTPTEQSVVLAEPYAIDRRERSPVANRYAACTLTSRNTATPNALSR